MPLLSILDVDRCKRLTDSGLTPVAEGATPRLRELWMGGTRVHGVFFALPSATPHLQVLDVCGTDLVDSALRMCCGMEALPSSAPSSELTPPPLIGLTGPRPPPLPSPLLPSPPLIVRSTTASAVASVSRPDIAHGALPEVAPGALPLRRLHAAKIALGDSGACALSELGALIACAACRADRQPELPSGHRS